MAAARRAKAKTKKMKLARPLLQTLRQTVRDNARRRRRPSKKTWHGLPDVSVGQSASAIAVGLVLTLECAQRSARSVACIGRSYGLELTGMYPCRSCGGTLQRVVAFDICFGNLLIQV